MKVCLISPPTLTEFRERQIADSDAHRLIAEHAPLGVLSLAAVLDQSGLRPEIIDLNRLHYQYINSNEHKSEGGGFADYVIRHFTPKQFDVFGFSTICSSYPLTLRIAQGVKRIHPEAKIVLGGPQASVVDVKTLQAFPFVDFVVRGEAEESLPRLLQALHDNDAGLSQINGITFRERGQIIRTNNAPVIADLDTLPFPAFHLYPHIESCSYAPLEAGRGCPFTCSFCSTNDFFRRRFRMKSAEVLVRQMHEVKETYGINSFNLVHDMFTVDRKKVMNFCDVVLASGEKFYWNCSARTDCVDEALISHMARAGCTGVFFGIDTGSKRMQEKINKRLDLPEAAAQIKHTTKHRMDTTVSLITGYPEETKEDLRDTIKFAGESLRHRTVDLQLHLLAPLAETPITTQFLEELVYDDIFSDISYQGWEQHPEDREMIVTHRDIFTNFYAVPTRSLDRHYLKELREFVLKGVLKHRWLMVFLHQDCGDLTDVFDEWLLWWSAHKDSAVAPLRDRDYYTGQTFSTDLLRFVEEHYSSSMTARPHVATTVAIVERAMLPFHQRKESAPVRQRKKVQLDDSEFKAIPLLVPEADVVHVKADYKKIMRCLKRRESLDLIATEDMTLAILHTGDNIEVLQLNALTFQLLSLCNGSRTVMEVVETLDVDQINGVSRWKAGLYGLASLTTQGLIDVKYPMAHSV